MGLSVEEFYKGLTTDEYWPRMKTNQDAILEVFKTVQPPAEATAFFDGLPQPLRLAVFTEDWCGDALTSTPSVLKLAGATKGLEVKVFERDKHREVTDSFLPEHRAGTLPVFVVFDQQMQEVARFIETAKELQPLVGKMNEEIRSKRLAAADADKGPREMTEEGRTVYRRETVARRVAAAPEWGKVMIESFARTVKEGLARPAGERPAVGGTEWPPR